MVQGIGNRANAMGQYNQERHNYAVARQNAGIAREEAGRARQEASRAEEAHRRLIREDLGAAFTAAAQSGARGGGGTTADRQLDQDATIAELDALNIRYGGELRANAALTDAANFDFEAKMAQKRAAAQKLAVTHGTAGQMLAKTASYGTSMQNDRLRAAERNAREPRYSYGKKNVRNTRRGFTAAPAGYTKPQSTYRGPGTGAKG